MSLKKCLLFGMWTSHMNLRLLLQVLLFSLVSLCSASLSGISGMFKGKKGLKEAILARNEKQVSNILQWKSCDILVEDEHALLQLFIETGQRRLLNDVLEGYDANDLEICLFKGVLSSLKYGDNMTLEALLTIIKDFKGGFLIGGVFEKCVHARNYKCIEIMTDWHYHLHHGFRNILHYAADLDDLKLFGFAPKDQFLMEARDDNGYFPMSHVNSKSMAEKLNERWVEETEKRAPKSWEAVQAMHSMTRLYRLEDHTLNYRATLLTNRLQNTAANSQNEPFNLKVSRDNVFEDSYKAVHKSYRTKFDWYRSNLKPKIIFDSEMGIDEGGPRLEWLGLMIKAMFQPNPDGTVENFTAPLFKEVDKVSGMYAPTMEYDDTVYGFAGTILALAFREKISLKVDLIPAIVKTILIKGEYSYNPADFQRQHPDEYRNLMKMKEMSEEDIEADDMYFISKPTLKVTKKNLHRYINDYGNHLCYVKYASALKALADGFNKINSIHMFHDVFNHQEMAAVLKGGTVIDLEDLRKQSVVFGSVKSQEIFWEMMEMLLTDEERLKFFKYVTGRNSVPFEGITGLKDKLEIVLDIQPPGYLPSASTCFSKINFACDINTAEEMKRRLLKAFDESLDHFTLH